MKHGIVIDSNNFHPITSAELRAAKAKGLLCNATEGTQYENPVLENQREAAKAAGIPFGSYLFLHPDSKGSEATFYLNYAKPRRGDFRPIIDAEVTNLGLDELADRVNSCAHALEAYGPKVRPILYAGYEVWNHCVARHPRLKKLDLWFAQYPGATRYSAQLEKLRIRLNGAHVVLWQFTDAYSIHGKTFDASVLYVPLKTLLIP